MNAIVPHRLQGAPLEGEILGPEDALEVIVSLNMFRLGADRIRVPAGSTIGEIVAAALAQHVGPKPARVVVLLGDQVIPEKVWDRVRPKPHAFVAVRGAPGKEGGILRNILLLAVGVASLAIPGLFPALSPFATSLIGAGLALGGTLLINALFPTRPPKLEDKGGVSQTYSIAGGSNTADPHGPIPFILGTHRYTPHLAARTYTEYTGGDQYYIAAFYWAYGSINIEDVKLGETPVGNYEDVRFQSDGYFLSDSETINLMPTQVIEETLSVELTNAGGWVTRTTAENTDRITLDIVAPNGVYKILSDNGKRKENKCTVASQYRRVGQSNWMTLKNWDFTSKSTEALRKGVSLNVSRGQYQVRVSKTSGDPDPNNKDKTVIEDLYWTALRSFRNGRPVNFDGPLAVSAIRIRATGQLNGTISNLNGIIKSRHNSWNGSAWKFGNSNNPADLYRHVLQGPFNARPVPTSKIDLERIQEFWSYCNAKGFAFNQVRDFRASVWDCLQDICAAAMAAPCFRDGLWSVAWDDPDAPVVGHFTPRNSRGFAGNRDYKQAPHALRVDFINEAAGYARDERIVFADGYNSATATLYERIEFPGVTNAALAWKLARLHMAQAKLRPETYRLVVAREHFRATFGDRVRVSHDIPLIGLTSGRVKAVDGQEVTLDEPVLMEGGNSYQMRFQLSGGDSLLRSVTYEAGSQTVVTLSGTDDVPSVGDLFMFGQSGSESAVFRIRNIRAIDEAEAELTLVDDAANLWDAVTGTIPAFDSQITIPPDPSTLAPTNLRVAEHLVAVGDVPTFAATFSWETLPGSAAVSFHTQIRDDGGDNEWRPLATVPAPQQSVIDISLYESDWSFRVRAVFDDGSVSAWTAITGETIAGGVPPDVANFRISAQEASATLSWDQVNTFGLDHYLIRFTTETDPELADWNTATELTTALSTSVQVPTLTGTYLIKAVNIVGTESVNAAILTSALGDISSLNVIQLYQVGPAWPGTFDGCEVNDDDALQLIAQPGVLDWGEILGIPSNYWSSQLESTIGTFTGEVIDLGEVSTSRLVPSIGAVTLEGDVESTAWSVRWLARITDDDPDDDPSWSEPFAITVGDYRFRAIEPILEIRSLAIGVHPRVATASLEIDMPDQLRAGENIEITEAGMFVPFVPPFRLYGGMGVADNNPGARVITSNANTDGFQVTAIDGSGDFVSGVKFSYNAKGAGSRSDAAAAGALYGWGLGTHGRLGNGSSARTWLRSRPSSMPAPGTRCRPATTSVSAFATTGRSGPGAGMTRGSSDSAIPWTGLCRPRSVPRPGRRFRQATSTSRLSGRTASCSPGARTAPAGSAMATWSAARRPPRSAPAIGARSSPAPTTPSPSAMTGSCSAAA